MVDDLQYCEQGAAPSAKVDATALGAADAAHSDNKAIEVDSTDQPGLYRVDWPDAAFDGGVGKTVVLTVKLAGSFTEHMLVQLSPPVDVSSVSASSSAADNAEIVFATDFSTVYDADQDRWAVDVNTVRGQVPATKADVADSVWDESQSGHTAAGTFGKYLDTEVSGVGGGDAGTIADEVVTRMDANSVDLNAIVADTNELQTDWADSGRLDSIIDAILVDTGSDGVVVAPSSKTGYKLAADGLDTVSTTEPTGRASDFREMIVQLWMRFFNKVTITNTTLTVYADDETTPVTT